MAGGRPRRQSARALEAAEHAAELDFASSVHTAPQSQRTRAPTRGRAAIIYEDEKDEDTIMPGQDGLGSDDEGPEPDLTLYCICLGFDTGEQRMIQCEHCSNWFHFGCIGLDNATADRIEAYVCDICSEMGQGTTRTIDNAPLAGFNLSQLPTTEDASSPDFDNDSDEERGGDRSDDEEWTYETRNDDTTRRRTRGKGPRTTKGDDEGQDEALPSNRRSSTSFYAKPAHAKRARSSSFLDDEDDDDIPTASRSKPRRSRKSAASPPPTVDPANAPSVPLTEKTRAHCIKQLSALFVSIFSASEADASAIGTQARATAFAEEVEEELFAGFFELDAKGYRSPKSKYVTKFRSLHYNLKTNAAFRSRISANELSAAQIVTMSNEDLLRPELRAMADSVRAASLKQSVKEVLAAPTAKRTHKGEEEIDTLANSIIAEEARNRQELVRAASPTRDRSASILGAASPSQQSLPLNFAGSPPIVESFSPTPSGLSPVHSPPIINAEHNRPSLTDASEQTSSETPSQVLGDDTGVATDTSYSDAHADDQMRPPPPPKARSSFDMSSVFGKIKPATESSAEPESTTPTGTPPASTIEPTADEQGEMDFLGARAKGDTQEDEDFEDMLLRGEVKKKHVPLEVKPEDLPQIWKSDLIVPDEGGFPALVVQLGGRPFGVARDVWKRLLPSSFTMDGRIPTATAVKYLVDCSLAPTRELVVLGMLPDLSGPTEESPYKPHRESCLVKHQHIIDFYVKRDRAGVIAPKGEMRKVVKDMYFLPLRKDAPFPEYIDLLDDNQIPPSRSRASDLLLAVLVLQKGVIPTASTTKPAATAPLQRQTSTAIAASVTSGGGSPIPGIGTTTSHPIVPTMPRAMQSAASTVGPQSQPLNQPTVPLPHPAPPSNVLQGIDTAALQSLLSNSSLLQSALAQSSAPTSSRNSAYASSHNPAGYGQYPSAFGAGPVASSQAYPGYASTWNPQAPAPASQVLPGLNAGGPGGYSPFSTGGYTPPQLPQGGGMSPATQSGGNVAGGGESRGAAYVHPSRAALLSGSGSDVLPSTAEGQLGGGDRRGHASLYGTGRGTANFGPPGSGWRGRGKG